MSVNGPLGVTAQRSRAFELRKPANATRAGSSRLGQLGLAGLLLTGLLISISAASTIALLPEPLYGSKPSLEGAFANISFHLPLVAVIATLTLMFVSYVVVVRCAEDIPARAILTTIAALNAILLLAPPLFSTDVFSYQGYAREWITYGANPYLTGPTALAAGPALADPLYPYIGADWINTPTVYGPLFTVLSAPLATASIAASLFTYKAVAAISCMGTVALIWHASRLRGLDPARGVALFGLNPLVVVYGVGGGHNDLLMLLLSTAAIYAVLAHREWTGGALAMLATAVKLTAGLVLPFALASGVELGASKRRRSLLLGASVVTAVIAALSFSLFGIGIFNLIPTLHLVQTSRDSHSIVGFMIQVFGRSAITDSVGIALGVVFLYVFVKLLRRVWRGEIDWLDGLGWATLALLVTASSVLPWYMSWLLPVVALCSDRRLWRWSMILSGLMLFTVLLGYIPHGDTFLGIPALP